MGEAVKKLDPISEEMLAELNVKLNEEEKSISTESVVEDDNLIQMSFNRRY